MCMSNDHTFLAISVGNSRSTIATIQSGTVENPTSFLSSETSEIVQYALKCWNDIDDENPQIIMAATNEMTGKNIYQALADQTSRDIWQIGDDIPPAIGEHLDPETITGIDRLLTASAAWDQFHEACVIVDAGTCVTVDFVDGEGTFHGGAIAPGARMQLMAMHNGTYALPEIDFEPPLREAFGKSTAQAMLQGVYHGIRGMVRQLTEQYSIRYGAYPTVIATGGDAEILFKDDELIEQIIPDLQLQGIAVSVRHTMAAEEHG